MTALDLVRRIRASSTSLLVSAVTLPISVIAFAVLYMNGDSFLSVVWLSIILPAIWLGVSALSIVDAFRTRSLSQLVGVVALLAPTAFFVTTMLSPRFAFHQLFTFQPLDLHLPAKGFVLMEKFMVCAEGQSCKSRDVVTATRSFHVKSMPEGCCSLAVINGRGGNKVDSFRVILNQKEVKLEAQKATVKLNADNEISVTLNGPPGAYIYVIVSFTGTKGSSFT